jgi:hypothetical protein
VDDTQHRLYGVALALKVCRIRRPWISPGSASQGRRSTGSFGAPLKALGFLK